MSKELKNIIKVACIYATSIIGAGFASGQEIMQFFSIYKAGGFYGILLAGALFAAIGCTVLERVYCERIRNYEEFLFPTFGWLIGWLIEAAVTLFMFCLFCIMIAGSGNVLADWLGISRNLAVLLMGGLSLVLVLTSIRGIAVLSTFVTPVLITGIMLAGFAIILYRDSATTSISVYITRITGNWFFSSLLYVSYNSILAVVMMCSLLPYLKTLRTARMGGILGGGMLCLAALVINAALFLFFPAAYDKELPVLSILKDISNPAGHLYSVILWLAMLVSAVTSGFCFTDRARFRIKLDRRLLTVVLCACAVPLSTLGFSRLIAVLYPIFGYIGLFMVLVVLIQGAVRLHKGLVGRYGRK